MESPALQYAQAAEGNATLLGYIARTSGALREGGRDSLSRSYNSARNSLSRFLDGADIPFAAISKEFITRYSTWLKENGVADSTQSFYLRTLRSILNHASGDGIAVVDENLFKGMNTRVLFSNSGEDKGILTRDVLKEIAVRDFSADAEIELVRDMFLFAFYCRGMELAEVMKLTKTNVTEGTLSYRRRGSGTSRVVRLDGSALSLIRKYHAASATYLFPLIEMCRGVRQYSVSDRVRKSLKQIGAAVGFPRLTFGMNISAWRQFMRQVDVSDILFKGD